MTIPQIPAVSSNLSRPLWSVMIPTYRPDIAMLREAIKGPLSSAIHRSGVQIAIVDDASGLACQCAPFATMLQECRDLGIEVHRYDSHLGLPGNWNRCLNLARGHYIHLLHQDDRVDPAFYEAIAAGFQTDARIGAAFTQHAFITREGDRIRCGHLHSNKARVLDDWLEYVFANLAIQCPAMVVRRVVYERLGGFDTSYQYCCDRDMWQRIALEYPLWFDPRQLSDFRVHPEGASAALRRRARSWWELNRCAREGARRISRPAREAAMRSFRRHTVRLAGVEVQQAIVDWDWRGVSGIAMGVAPMLRARELRHLKHRRYDRTPPSRAPDRPFDDAAKRNPRILLLSEFFPWDPIRSVFGAMQRLSRHVRALDRLGPIDAVFFSKETQPISQNDSAWRSGIARQSLPLRGSLYFVATGDAKTWRDRVSDAFWTARGFVGFFNERPNMRSCRWPQIESLEGIIRESQPDLIFAYYVSSAVPLLRIRSRLPPIIVDFNDLESVKLARLAMSKSDLTGIAKARFGAMVARLAQRRVSAMASSVLVCSELERRKVLSTHFKTRVIAVPNTAAAFGLLPDAVQPVALFVGTAWYPPNREAILWLANQIWPHVRREVPKARLIVVGEKTDELGISAPELGIEALGFVANLAPLYAEAMLAVCPVRRGSGTRIKIIEAAFNRRPVVSTALGAEGLVFTADTEILIEDDAKRFAAACVELFRDPQLAARIGQAAALRAQSTYQETRAADLLRAICSEALRDDHGMAEPPIESSAVLAAEKG